MAAKQEGRAKAKLTVRTKPLPKRKVLNTCQTTSNCH